MLVRRSYEGFHFAMRVLLLLLLLWFAELCVCLIFNFFFLNLALFLHKMQVLEQPKTVLKMNGKAKFQCFWPALNAAFFHLSFGSVSMECLH